jgi:hypothetical protein
MVAQYWSRGWHAKFWLHAYLLRATKSDDFACLHQAMCWVNMEDGAVDARERHQQQSVWTHT